MSSTAHVSAQAAAAAAWLTPEDCRLSDLLAVLDEQTRLEDYPHASRVDGAVVKSHPPVSRGLTSNCSTTARRGRSIASITHAATSSA